MKSPLKKILLKQGHFKLSGTKNYKKQQKKKNRQQNKNTVRTSKLSQLTLLYFYR